MNTDFAPRSFEHQFRRNDSRLLSCIDDSRPRKAALTGSSAFSSLPFAGPRVQFRVQMASTFKGRAVETKEGAGGGRIWYSVFAKCIKPKHVLKRKTTVFVVAINLRQPRDISPV